MGHQHSVNLKP